MHRSGRVPYWSGNQVKLSSIQPVTRNTVTVSFRPIPIKAEWLWLSPKVLSTSSIEKFIWARPEWSLRNLLKCCKNCRKFGPVESTICSTIIVIIFRSNLSRDYWEWRFLDGFSGLQTCWLGFVVVCRRDSCQESGPLRPWWRIRQMSLMITWQKWNESIILD